MAVLFAPENENEWPSEYGFVGLIHPARGATRRSLLLSEIIPQEIGWVYEDPEGLMFSPRYFSKALDRVSDLNPHTGLLVVHSHPGDSGDPHVPPTPSKWDLEGEVTLLRSLAHALPPGAPVAAGIMGPSGSCRVREYLFSTPRDEDELRRSAQEKQVNYRDAQATRIVGSAGVAVLELPGIQPLAGKARRRADSTIRLWGAEAQNVLARRTFGIAGCGGLGSLLAEYLAKIGVGRLILVDYELVDEENLNRMTGVTAADVGKRKVECIARHCREVAVAPAFDAIPVPASASEDEGLRPLLDADVILAAADPPHVRQVLDHAAYAHLIPVIDGGTLVVPGTGARQTGGRCQITDGGPERPCLECSGVYDKNDVTEWLERPEFRGRDRYVVARSRDDKGPNERAPSILSLNAFVASQVTLRALDKILGFLPFRPENQQRYYIAEGRLDWGPRTQCLDGCPKASWVGHGALHSIPVAIDPVWATMRHQGSK